MSYRHLTVYERSQIETLSALGYSCRAVARLLGRHHSTINRELQRNKGREQTYQADKAHLAYQARRRKSSKKDSSLP